VGSARDDVLAFTVVPRDHWRKIWSTNPISERLNEEIKRRGNVVGIGRRPAHGADVRQLSHRRTFTANPITPRD
jgi:transposase-like protein